MGINGDKLFTWEWRHHAFCEKLDYEHSPAFVHELFQIMGPVALLM